jgi:hypothetical protein
MPLSWLASWMTSVSARGACLLTQQAARPGTMATPASLPMLMIRPKPRACMPGSTAAHSRAAARTLTAEVRSHSAMLVASSGSHTA